MGQLSPKLETWLEGYNQTLKELLESGFQLTPAIARKGLADLTSSLIAEYPKIDRVLDDKVDTPNHGIPVRIYCPDPDEALHVLIYAHGGGHVAGSVEVYDPICRKIAIATNHIVVSVDYRLAPEHPYPAGIEDVVAVIEQVWPTLERHRLTYRKQLSIAGDSGGGAVCASVAHQAQDQPDSQIQHQVLIYPSLDYTMTLPSITSNGSGYLLESSRMEWYFKQYFQHDENRKATSPLHMEYTRHLPRTLVVTAEFCPLRDEGIAYVEKLKSHGIEAKRLHLDDMIHAFLNMETLTQEACDETYSAIGEFLRT